MLITPSALPDRIKPAAATVSVTDTVLIIAPRGMWKFLSLRRRLEIPLADVASWNISTRPGREVPVRLRIGGTATGWLLAGTMLGHGRRSWWAHRYGRAALVITLEGNTYAYVVVDVDNPAAVGRAMDAARARDAGAKVGPG